MLFGFKAQDEAISGRLAPVDGGEEELEGDGDGLFATCGIGTVVEDTDHELEEEELDDDSDVEDEDGGAREFAPVFEFAIGIVTVLCDLMSGGGVGMST